MKTTETKTESQRRLARQAAIAENKKLPLVHPETGKATALESYRPIRSNLMTHQKTPEQIKAEIKATIETVRAIADAIRELKQIPSGHLYAQLMSHMDLATYERIIQTLKNTGLVTESNYMLTWVEPRPLTKAEHDAFPKGRWS